MRGLVIAILILIGLALLAGCGGSATPFSPMNSSLQQQFESAARPALTTRPASAPKLWDAKALAQQPLDAKPEPVKEETIDKTLVRVQEVIFNGEKEQEKAARLSAVLVSPVPGPKVKRLPAVLVIGESKESAGAAARHLAVNGYTALAYAPGGLTDEAVYKAKPALKDSALYGLVSGAMRAVSLLADQPTADPRKVGVLGIGWGGVAACLMNAVDKRVQAVSAVLTGPEGVRTAWNEQIGKLGEDRERWILAYDPLSYLGDMRQPIQLQADPSGKFYPVSGIRRLSQDAKSDVTLLFRVRPKGQKAEDVEAARIWLDSALKNAPKLPGLKAQADGKESVTITAQGGGPLKAVTLYYALGNPLALEGRPWKAVEARQEGGKWQAALPKETAGQEIVYFAVAQETRGGAVSSDIASRLNAPQPS
ncbi:MAG: hypothetical protein IT210_26155 [Armatimonadetes bacterium]|nr:hypothetical protein [Armatimonadota bacterium]